MLNKIVALESKVPPPISSRIQELPFETLPWELFEDLCLKLVQLEFPISECEKRGILGQNQQGIDIFAKHDDGLYSVYQCKKYTSFTKSNLKNVISKFRDGKYYEKSKKFYICTACNMNSTTMQDQFEEYRIKLKKDGINLIKWDNNQLNRILKNHPKIVYDIFGPEYVIRFNGIESLNQVFKIPVEHIYDIFKVASSDLNGINNEFSNIPNSHIERKETTDLYNWTKRELQQEESNIAVLAGNAGTGKSVILKDLIHLLSKNNLPVLGLKADKKLIDLNNLGKSVLDIEVQIFDVFKQLLLEHELVVVIIDQIDALSRSLSTKRNQLQAYGSLINKLSTFEGLRIIVSCRIFDLNYEPEFKQFTNKKIIKTSILPENEVERTLKSLTGQNQDYFPKDLLTLLQTPLHLDVFCKIYNPSTSFNEIKSLQDLYRNLWNEKIRSNQNKTGILPLQLETVIYEIANQIYNRQENLSVPVSLFDNYLQEISYLTSENLIINQEGYIVFFHQSFFDYIYSRYFVENKGGNIFNFLITQNHQGLYLRSITKQVIAYLRIFNPQKYLQELKKIILSDKIRYHIKLLIIEQLAFEEKPKLDEFKLIFSLSKNNKSLLLAFLNCIPKIGWFRFFATKQDWLLNFYYNGDNTTKNIVSKFIVFEADQDVETALNIITQIKDVEPKERNIRWLLFRAKDYSKEIIISAYHSIEKSSLLSERDLFHILENAIKSNPEFAICESRKVFYFILKDWKKQRKRLLEQDSHEKTFFRFCNKLCENAPEKAYNFIMEIIDALINKTVYEKSVFNLNVLEKEDAFDSYQPDIYLHHEILSWIISYLQGSVDKDLDFVQNELTKLIQSNSASKYFIALQLMLSQPYKFRNEIFPILTNQNLLADLLQINDLKYVFRELLNKTYLSYPNEKQNAINEFILKYFPQKDFYFDSEYLNQRKKTGTYSYPYPIWGYDQWLLLKSLPREAFKRNAELRARVNMLSRRFNGYRGDNKKPSNNVTFKSPDRGIMSQKNYEKLSAEQWLNSFLKLEGKDFVYRFERNYSLEEHAESFKKVVERDSEKFYPFVRDIIVENQVHFRYQISGLEGLVKGESEITKVRKIYNYFMNREISGKYQVSIVEISKCFIENSVVDESLITYWQNILESPLKEERKLYIVDNQKDRNDVLFSEGWNSFNGKVSELIISLSDEDLYTERIYKYLLGICNDLPIQIRLVILYRLNEKYAFSHEDLLVLFLSYVKDFTPELYYVAPQLIHDLIYYHFDQIVPFLEESIKHTVVAESLGVLLLFGWFYGNEKSREFLFMLHDTQPSSIEHTIEMACKYLNHSEYGEKSLCILKRYSRNMTKEVTEGYSRGFLDLKPNDLLSIQDIILQYISVVNEESLFSLYRYLNRCANSNPNECISIINSIDFEKTIRNSFELKEPFKILILCYNAIREYDTDEDNIEFAMDTLDLLLQHVDSDPEIDIMLKELDIA